MPLVANPGSTAENDDLTFVAIDLETANRDRASICAVGIAVVEGGQLVHRALQLIRPHPPIFEARNVSIHGIRDEDVKDAPTFEEYWPTLRSHLRGSLIAHNASFDIGCLRSALRTARIPVPRINYYCTRILASLVWPGHVSYSLRYLATFLGIDFQHHNAEEDAVVCALLCLTICRQAGVGSLAELCRALRVPERKISEVSVRPSAHRLDLPVGHGKPWMTRNGSPLSRSTIGDQGRLNGQVFVFTGALATMTRRQAAEAVTMCGGVCRESVSVETDYLVVGGDGCKDDASAKKSTKRRQAEELMAKGSRIKIIEERKFLELIWGRHDEQ